MWCCLQVTLCDPYMSALEAFAWTPIQINVYFILLYYYIDNVDVAVLMACPAILAAVLYVHRNSAILHNICRLAGDVCLLLYTVAG